MKNKKILITFIVILIIVAVLFGIYKVYSSHLFDENNSIPNGKLELIEHLKSIEDSEERKKQIDFCLEYNSITQEEANELY